VVWLDDLDSTAALADRLMASWLEDDEEPMPETLLVAGRQRSGRGRGTHTWASPPGGLYANWLAWVPAAELALVPIAVGVTLGAAVELLLPSAKVGLKWPNDLIVDGKKLGGILCQSRGSGELVWVSVGFGINLAADPVLVVNDEARAVSLRALGWPGDLGDGVRTVTEAFLKEIHRALADAEGTRRRWVARSVHRSGDTIRLRLSDGVVEGRFIGFDRDCRLALEVNGQVRQYSVGEIMLGVDPGGA
jgi:BirA family biotin operon repressor/biotin-[acetyl-CoA-carboxylase] ligase